MLGCLIFFRGRYLYRLLASINGKACPGMAEKSKRITNIASRVSYTKKNILVKVTDKSVQHFLEVIL